METPAIDLTKIDFPSDKLTIKMVREAYPGATDVDFDKDSNPSEKRFVFSRQSLDYSIGSLLDLERELAEKVFNCKLGLPERESYNKKEDLIDYISDEYIKMRLAFGQHDSLAMIQKIEKQAEAQARQFSGPSR